MRVDYRCKFKRDGARSTWLCGACGKGKLGSFPKLGEGCVECGSRVTVAREVYLGDRRGWIVDLVEVSLQERPKGRAKWAKAC
jgi:hypothetical protein